jgi:hypothetical protein
MDNDKLNRTSQEIVTACLSADDPVACLYSELDRLRASGEWSELELSQLQRVLLVSVKLIVSERESKKSSD